MIDGKHLPHLRDIFTDDDAELIIRLCRDTLQCDTLAVQYSSFRGSRLENTTATNPQPISGDVTHALQVHI